MLTTLFNCSYCRAPLDCKPGMPRSPVYSPPLACCWSCASSAEKSIERGLMEFLDQPGFRKTIHGYEWEPRIKIPQCSRCRNTITAVNEWAAVPGTCGHYLCKECDVKRRSKGNWHCTICKKKLEDAGTHSHDHKLASFLQTYAQVLNQLPGNFWELLAAATDEVKKLRAEREKEKYELELLGTKLQLASLQISMEHCKHCSKCGGERPVERLYKCQDCQTINCAECSFDFHREHAVDKLLGIELDKLEKENGAKYSAILGGLHGNLQHVQQNVNDAVMMVLGAGKQRLARMRACSRYADAQNIVSIVDRATNDFEKHCEVYIPVARELATQLRELGEELLKEEGEEESSGISD